MLSEANRVAVEAAKKAGSLYGYKPQLDKGQSCVRSVWLRKDVRDFIDGPKFNSRQKGIVHAALKRFVVGGSFTVLTAGCEEPVAGAGDIKELDHVDRLTVELRFKPPPYQLRLFGRFIEHDALVLTTYGMKGRQGVKGAPTINYGDHYARCQTFFSNPPMQIACPQEIRKCISNGRFL